MKFSRKIAWKAVQIFIAEVLAAGITNFPCFLLNPFNPNSSVIGPVVGGAAIYLAIWCTFPTSGSHINPMVTLAALLTCREKSLMAVVYFVGEFAGTIGGMWIASAISPYKVETFNTYGMTMPGRDVGLLLATVTEGVITFILLTVILASLDETRVKPWQSDMGIPFPLAVMLTIALLSYLAGPISGGSMNPFRSICAAIIQGNYEHQWIYFVGPIIGTLVACLIYEVFVSPGASMKQSRFCKCDRHYERSPAYDSVPDYDDNLIPN
ncbi:hypothetical protein Aperf_G00000102563 [Anoplocephala perfoliata]